MTFPADWQSPITASPGQLQANVNPLLLLPSRHDLSHVRYALQKALSDAATERSTPIEVTPDGVIWDGHHAVRVAAEAGTPITVKVVSIRVKPTAVSILDLTVG